jgi:hypothetical protein
MWSALFVYADTNFSEEAAASVSRVNKVSQSVEYLTLQKELKPMWEPVREKGGFISGKAW